MCPMCKLKPETVEHFITESPHYTDERIFYGKIIAHFPTLFLI